MKRLVFISYRRRDGHELAQLVESELRARGVRTFMDVTDPQPGRFWQQIEVTIASCRAFVLVCTPGTFAPVEGVDWVTREVGEALKQSRQIVPVLSHDFERPAKMSEAVARALEFNGISMDTQYPDAAFDRLAKLTGAGRGSSAKRVAVVAGMLGLLALAAGVGVRWRPGPGQHAPERGVESGAPGARPALRPEVAPPPRPIPLAEPPPAPAEPPPPTEAELRAKRRARERAAEQRAEAARQRNIDCESRCRDFKGNCDFKCLTSCPTQGGTEAENQVCEGRRETCKQGCAQNEDFCKSACPPYD